MITDESGPSWGRLRPPAFSQGGCFAGTLFRGDATVEVAVGLGRPLQVELLNRNRREGLGGNQGLDVAVQMTAIGQVHFEPVQAALPFPHSRLRAEAVFEEQELSVRLENSTYFGQRPTHVLDAA